MNKKSLHIYIFVTLTVAFLVNMLIFSGTKLITAGWHHTDMALVLDELIPFVPAFIVIYVAGFAFWLICYYIAALGSSDNRQISVNDPTEGPGGLVRCRFFAADVLSKFICLAFFLLLPTTMERPDPGTDTVLNAAVSLIYMIDAPDNLFPSIHCLVSWFCWIAVRDRKDLPPALRYFVLVFAILICISTVAVKQHVCADVFSGVILAEFCYWLTGFEGIRRLYTVPMQKLLSKLINRS